MTPTATIDALPPLFTDAEYAQMRADIADVSLLLGTALPPGFGASADGKNVPASPAERLQVLQQAMPAVAQCVRQIAHSPPLSLARETKTVAPPARARRVTPAALLNAVRVGVPLRAIEETVSVVTRDTPELQNVLRFLLALRKDAHQLQALAERDGETDAVNIAKACALTLNGLLRLPVWDGVNVPNAPAPPTLKTLSSPALARLHMLSRTYFRALTADADASNFLLPPREAWRVYETWTLFTAARALLTLGFTTNGAFPVRRDRFTHTLHTDAAGCLELRHTDGRQILLTYQPTFAAGARSRSRTMQPDVTIENEDGGVWIVDAKWKRFALPGDEGTDINQMHAYRDAILTRDGAPAVRRAWCAFAGDAGALGRAIIHYGPVEHSVVGAVRLRPLDAQGFDWFRTLLASWLDP